MFSEDAIKKLVKDYVFQTVLDIGSGSGVHSKYFVDAGKTVSAVDLGRSIYYEQKRANYEKVNVHHVDFFQFHAKPYDCIWASHVLEHQRNPGAFLEHCFDLTRDIFAVTVPPLKHDIVGGHLTLWNAGLLIYNMILAGFDCSKASVLSRDYNISVIVRKAPVSAEDLNALHYDSGDIVRLAKYFPVPVFEGFNGQIPHVNW